MSLIEYCEPAARLVPAQKPGRSKQDYATPREFLDAVEQKFGPIGWDLAADHVSSVAGGFNYFGPDHIGATLYSVVGKICPRACCGSTRPIATSLPGRRSAQKSHDTEQRSLFLCRRQLALTGFGTTWPARH